MFGHDHDDKKDQNDNNQPISTQPVNHGLLGIDDDNDAPASASPAPEPSSSPLPDPTQATAGFVSSPIAPSPLSDSPTPSSPAPEPPTVKPVDDVNEQESTPSAPEPSAVTPIAPSESSSPSSDEDLADIKRQALQELSPLIDHLDQNSEEKFKTTMMMIQASDDKDLIPQAFKAAKEITDEKKRAQALLDIVNEVNYFTHKTDD